MAADRTRRPRNISEHLMHNSEALPGPALNVDAVDAEYLTRLLNRAGYNSVKVAGLS